MTEAILEQQAESEAAACQNVPRGTLVPGILGRALKALQLAQPVIRQAARHTPSVRHGQELEALSEDIAAILDGKPASAEGR